MAIRWVSEVLVMGGEKLFLKWSRSLSDILQTLCLGLMTVSMLAQPLPAMEHHAAASGLPALADQKKWKLPLSEDEKIYQLLNRITFGARPGDVERVRQIGVTKFLDEQLYPERIDDSAVEGRVQALPTLAMTPEELVENYPQPKQAAKLAEKQAAQKKFQPQPATRPLDEMALKMSAQGQSMADPQGPQGPQRVIMELAQEEVLRAAYSDRQLQEVMVQFWMNHFNIFAPKGADKWLTTSFERDTIRPRALGKFEDLLVATAHSPAMLFYLDNWMSTTPNPTYAGNVRPGRGRPARGSARPQFGVWRPFGPRGAIRRTAQGPLGNPQLPNAQARPGQGGQPNNPQRQNRRGLNENYAREVMELHTLGVEGGYTQRDVIEVARCLTGWTIDRPQQGGGFIFRPQMHDFGEKTVLGNKIRGGQGEEDGMQVLRLLAHNPATARFIALKFCRRLVADDPPPALIDQASKTFLSTDGDIRQVLKTILTSPQFYSQAAYRVKVKSPLELVVSSVRAMGGQTNAGVPLLQMIARMGQPMFQYQAPTGFPDRASTWINSGSLLMRINFATQFAANRIPGTQIDLSGFTAPTPGAAQPDELRELAARLVGGDLSQPTRDALLSGVNQTNDPVAGGLHPGRDVATLTGLLIASPEFQRR